MLISLPRPPGAGRKIAGKAKMRGDHAHISAPAGSKGQFRPWEGFGAALFPLFYDYIFDKIKASIFNRKNTGLA